MSTRTIDCGGDNAVYVADDSPVYACPTCGRPIMSAEFTADTVVVSVECLGGARHRVGVKGDEA